MIDSHSRSDRIGHLALASLLLVTMVFLTFAVPVAQAQTQTITVTQGTVNLGMTSSVVVTAPAAGTYTVVVVKPSGTSTSLNFTFTAAGQKQNATFGGTTVGFKAAVDQVGTYNIFLEQGGQVVGTTSLYATNKLLVSMDFVTGGTCAPVGGNPRGTKIFPRYYVVYASNGTPLTNNSKGAYVTYNYPDGTKINASWHRPTTAAGNFAGSGGNTGFFIGKFQPSWNYTTLGPWSPTATIGDAYGNTATYSWTGPAFQLTPATLATNVQLMDAKSGQLVTGLYSGQNVTVKATITYPTYPEIAPGFAGVLDSAARGGVVNALFGWGFYNATNNSFGSAKNPGGLISQVALKYTGANGTWLGNFAASSLPSLQAGTNFVMVLNAADKAAPPNTGFSMITLPPATIQSVTTTATSVATSVSTATTTQTSVSTAVSNLVSTVTQAASTVTQAAAGVPTVVYAGMAVLLVIGLIIGYIMRMPRR